MNNEKYDVVPEVEEVVEVVEPVEETVVIEPAPPVYGEVVMCQKLNIRVEPNKEAEVVAVVPANSKLAIDPVDIFEDWFSVSTEHGIEGFAMKNFVRIER